jgi:hypothetical protein
MDGNRDLAQLAVVSASHEKYVEAFLQMPSFFRFESGPELQAKF